MQRVVEKQQRFSLSTTARMTEILLQEEQIGLSDTSVIRLVRRLPDPEVQPVRVLGVDDWAKRKGQRYGTIRIDLERSQVIDILEDRTADTLANWLEEQPTIEIVSRDRSQTYAEAIARAVPDAIHIADRFHLLRNLSETVYRVLQQMETVEQLRQLGWSQKQIDQQVNLLDPWLEQASSSKKRVWKSFAAGLKQDLDAISNALTFLFSNEPMEGHVIRLKCIKRIL